MIKQSIRKVPGGVKILNHRAIIKYGHGPLYSARYGMYSTQVPPAGRKCARGGRVIQKRRFQWV